MIKIYGHRKNGHVVNFVIHSYVKRTDFSCHWIKINNPFWNRRLSLNVYKIKLLFSVSMPIMDIIQSIYLMLLISMHELSKIEHTVSQKPTTFYLLVILNEISVKLRNVTCCFETGLY